MNTTYIVLGVIALAVIFGITQYNKLIRLNVSVDEAFAQIEVQLKRRSDLIPNLVETVKGYAAHEKKAFEKVSGLVVKKNFSFKTADNLSPANFSKADLSVSFLSNLREGRSLPLALNNIKSQKIISR